MCTDPCIVCSEGDECGPVQHTDCCDKPFHIGLCRRCKAEKKRRKAEAKATAIVEGDGEVA